MRQKQSVDYKSIDRLHFDPHNPRLPSAIDGRDEQLVLQWMLEDASIIELMLSIGEKDYFPGESILVVPREDMDGHYYVVEGNRRLTATKLLVNPELAPVRKKAVEQASQEAKFKPTELPTLEFSKRADILDYLGYRHITGVKAWGALAKAKYLYQLAQSVSNQDPQEQHKELAKAIGSRSDYVARQLAGYSVYEKIVDEAFFKIKNLDEESINFSVLTTALNYPIISRFIGMTSPQDRQLQNLGNEELHELVSWLFEKNSEGQTRIGESRNLGKLSSVISHPDALSRFRSGEPLVNAVLYTEVPSQVYRQSVAEAKSRLESARMYIHQLNDPDKVDSETLLDIQKIARALRAVIEDKRIEAGLDL